MIFNNVLPCDHSWTKAYKYVFRVSWPPDWDGRTSNGKRFLATRIPLYCGINRQGVTSFRRGNPADQIDFIDQSPAWTIRKFPSCGLELHSRETSVFHVQWQHWNLMTFELEENEGALRGKCDGEWLELKTNDSESGLEIAQTKCKKSTKCF